MIAEKSCLCCSKVLRGRTDKKFCSDSCRSTHHNSLHSGNTQKRAIHRILQKNYRILEKTIGASRSNTKIARKQLELSGFNFSYFTHYDSNRLGRKVRCCYNLRYRVVKELVFVMRSNMD